MSVLQNNYKTLRQQFLKIYSVILSYCQVMKRALRAGNIEQALTWSRDVLMTLHKRQEVMCVNKPLNVGRKPQSGFNSQQVDGRGKEGGVEAKRFAAAVVEFTQAAQSRAETRKSTNNNNGAE